MFWGITLDTGKKYTQIVEKSFHLSMAALGFQTPSEAPVTVMVEINKAQFALCTLQAGRIPQQPLDLNFTEGEEVTFFTEGNGDVHLTGFLQEEPETVEYEDIDENLSSTEASDSEGSDEEVNSDEDSLEGEMSLHELLEDAAVNALNGDDDDDDDEDFDPTKSNPGKRKKRKVKQPMEVEQKNDGEKSETSGGKKVMETASSLSLLDIELSDDDDDAWTPKKGKVDKIKITKAKHKSKKQAGAEKVNGEVDYDVKAKVDEQDKEKDKKKTSEESLKKKHKKKRKLKHEDAVVNDEDSNVTQDKKQKRTEISDTVENASGTSINNNHDKDDKSTDTKDTASEKNNSEKTVQESHKVEDTSANNAEIITNGRVLEEGMQSPSKEKSKPTKLEKRTITGGTVIEDLKIGSGKVAQKGKRVFVYHRGVLAKNQKEFDSCLKGKPFSFVLGKGEVISAWENALEGMKVGGKRKVTALPSQAYGSQKLPGIPPNSTLVFEIQLVRVS